MNILEELEIYKHTKIYPSAILNEETNFQSNTIFDKSNWTPSIQDIELSWVNVSVAFLILLCTSSATLLPAPICCLNWKLWSVWSLYYQEHVYYSFYSNFFFLIVYIFNPELFISLVSRTLALCAITFRFNPLWGLRNVTVLTQHPRVIGKRILNTKTRITVTGTHGADPRLSDRKPSKPTTGCLSQNLLYYYYYIYINSFE